MPSFGSDFAYGLTYPRQRWLAVNSYSWRLAPSVASELLNQYGIGYVVIPGASAGLRPRLGHTP